MAHHPHLGFGFVERSLADLRGCAAQYRPVVITLNPGHAIEGHVIDENGKPVVGARVFASMEPESKLNLSGLHTLSDEEGYFLLRGITHQNRPQRVTAMVESREQLLSVRKNLTVEAFDRQIGVWDAGELTITPKDY
ncbi:MAG: hypothetical protein AAF517_06125 [Planctomycetota bacterium]